MSEFSSGERLVPLGNDIYDVVYGDDKGLYVEFFAHQIEDKKASEAAGRPIFKEVDYIKITPRGDKTKVRVRPVQLKYEQNGAPPDNIRWPRQYEAYKNKTQTVLHGTPITEWPAITRSDAESFKAMNIHTIEDLAELQENNLTWLGARQMRDKAKAWIEKANKGVGASQWAREKAEMQAQIDALKNQLNGFASVGAIPESKKRGRKPKVKDEQDVTSISSSGG